MSLIKVSNLTFAYEGSYDNVFTDVSFQIDTDWKLGFCGRNGRGKTTFLKLLMGKYDYKGGISASVSFDYFPFPVVNPKADTLEILEGIAPGAPLWKIQREISKLAVSGEALYRPFHTLSNGEQTKTLLAGLFLRENNFLLIDEPTNHLDMAARQTVAEYLKGKAGFILVSHDRAFLDGCVDHILSINRNNIEVTCGNFSVWAEQKERRDSFEIARNEKLLDEIQRLKSAAKRSSDWAAKGYRESTGRDNPDSRQMGYKEFHRKKAGKLDSQAKSMQNRQDKAAGEKSKLLKNIETAEELKIRPLEYHSQRLLTLSGVAVSYGGREILKDFDLTLERGDRVALLGGNGSGKSSIMKLVCGGDIPHTGQVDIGSRLTVSYVPQDASFLAGSLENYAEERKIDGTLFKSILSKLDFSRVQFGKDMRDFSAGQKKKVLIARSLCERAHVYVWDEPLNYIDVLSRMQIEELILEYKPAMIFAEHDKAFCDKIATSVIRLG